MRRLVFDEAPSGQLSGVDLVSHWDVGFEMFRDRDKFQVTFFLDDILHPDKITVRKGTFDVIALSLVLHQWTFDEQVAALKNVVDLSAPNMTVAGLQVGNYRPKCHTIPDFQTTVMAA